MRHVLLIILGIAVFTTWRPQAVQAVTIEFDYRYDSSGFFSDPTRKATLEAAGAAWEKELERVQLPAIPLGTGINTWTLKFNRPDQSATFEEAKNTELVNKPVPENTIVIYVGARPDVYGGYLGYAEFGYSVFGDASWVVLFQNRDNGDNFQSFGGSVSFDSDANWHFDADPESKEEFPGQFDFYTIALHEIGHLLGFTPDVPAFYRKTLGGSFLGPTAVALYGSAPPFGFGGHWPSNFEFDGKGMVMDAVLPNNVRRHINPLEMAVLRDLGYVVSGGVKVVIAPPEAVAAGARWKINGVGEQVSGVTLSGLPAEEHTIELKPVPGFITPLAQTIDVVGGETLQIEITYEAIPVPTIVEGPATQWVEQGQNVTLQVEADAGGAEVSYQWRKAGKAISNATTASITFANAGLSLAGTYDVEVWSTTGPAASRPSAHLGVVGVVNGPSVVTEAGTLSLTQTAAGPGLTFQWLRDGQPLVNDAVSGMSGVDRAKLVIKNVDAAAAGVYACRLAVANAAGGDAVERVGPEHAVAVTRRPVVDDLGFGPWRVGGTVTDLVTAQNGATRFAVAGLPTGVALNPTTGQLSGRPRQAKTYRLTITAFNAAGRSLPKVIEVPCEGFAIKAQGAFDGLIERATLNAKLGGTFKAKVAGTGAVSGQLTLGRTKHRFAGSLETLPGPNPTASFTISRGRVLNALTLTVQIDASNGELTGTLADGEQPEVDVLAWRNPWHRRNAPLTDLAGTYTAAIRPIIPPVNEDEEEAPPIPQEPPYFPLGAGFVVAKVSTGGVVAWSGRLADGTGLTRSSTLSETGNSSYHLMLYGGIGSVQGWNVWLPALNEEVEPTLDGTWDWFKYPVLSAKATNYKGGFPLHELKVTGGKYLPPEKGKRVLEIEGSPLLNARLAFVSGGIEQSIFGAATSVEFALTTANKMMPLPLVDNPAQTRLTKLVANTGAFQGRFVLKDPQPGGGKDLLRRTSFFGLLVPRLGRGYGYFLLPELTSNKPIPLLSGEVVLEKVVPVVIE